MGLRTASEFRDSVRDNRAVYYMGKRVADVTTHPAIRVGVETACIDYEITEAPQNREWAVCLNKDGEPYSRYFQAPRTADDLLARCRLIEAGSRRACGFPPFAKEGGADGLNAITIVAARMDKELGTHYHDRVEQWRRYLQDHDFSLAVAMTDMKGDRRLRPSQQHDPDLYVHIVDRRPDGLVVRGAKAHITSAPYTNEILVVPTRQMSESDRDYAVAFAIPANHPGVKMICHPEPAEHRDPREFPVSTRYAMLEAIVVLDDVLVPWERVFMAGEWQFAGLVTTMFANFHRVTAATYKYPFARLLVGTAHLVAEANGLLQAAHVRDKLAHLLIYAETIAALARAACLAPETDPVTGIAYPDPTTSNAAKFFFANFYHEAIKSVQDIAGGLVATQPSFEDWDAADTGPYLQKYLAGNAAVSAQNRFKAFKLLRDLAASDLSGYWEVTTIHAEGSLAAQRLAVLASADWESYRVEARRAAGMEG